MKTSPSWSFQRMLEQVEQLAATDCSSLAQLRQRVHSILELPEDPQELTSFQAFLNQGDPNEWCQVSNIPYRRVLNSEELARSVTGLETRWGHWYGGYCNRQQDDAVTIESADTSFLNSPTSRRVLRHAIRELSGSAPLFELNEIGPSFEQEAGCVSLYGSERFWTPADFSWMLYSSHEDTLTFAGLPLLHLVGSAL